MYIRVYIYPSFRLIHLTISIYLLIFALSVFSFKKKKYRVSCLCPYPCYIDKDKPILINQLSKASKVLLLIINPKNRLVQILLILKNPESIA